MTINWKGTVHIFKILDQVIVAGVTLFKLFEGLIILFQNTRTAVNIALNSTLHPCVTYIKFRISQEQGSDNRERQDYQEPCIYSRRLHITLKEINNGQNTKDYFCNLQVYPILMQPEVRHGHNNKLQ